MAASGNSIALKSFQSFTVNDGLLAKVVEAVKAGEKEARTSGVMKSFEVFYRGFRQNIAIGRVNIIPVKVCNNLKDFPVALLYGTVVRVLNLGEEVADLIEKKIGETEFDEYSQADIQTIKDSLFKDAESEEYRSLVLFAPSWSNVRDYVVFKFTEDDDKLANLIRHQIFSSYFNPSVSAAFDALMTTVDTTKLDLTDVTPKLSHPFLTQNPLKQYPDLLKTGGWAKPKIFLTAKTADAITKEVLDPEELSVFEDLDAALTNATMPEVAPMDEVADFKGPDGSNHGNAETPQVAGEQPTTDLLKDDSGAETGLRRQPDYGESDSFTSKMNEENAKAAASKLGAKFRRDLTECPDCGKPLDAFGMCPQVSGDDARQGQQFCGQGKYVPNIGGFGGASARPAAPSPAPQADIYRAPRKNIQTEPTRQPGRMVGSEEKTAARFDPNATECADCGRALDGLKTCRNARNSQQFCGIKREAPKKDIKTEPAAKRQVASAPFETPFTNVGPGTAAHENADTAIAVKVDSVSTKGEEPIGIELDETGLPVRKQADTADNPANEKDGEGAMLPKTDKEKPVTAGRTITPKYVLRVTTPGFYTTPMGWDLKHMGKPTDQSLAKWVADFNSSTEPGQPNEHLGPGHKVTQAEVFVNDGTYSQRLAVYPAGKTGSKKKASTVAAEALKLLDEFFEDDDMQLTLASKALQVLQQAGAFPDAAKEIEAGIAEPDLDWALDYFDNARGILMTALQTTPDQKAAHVARAISKELGHEFDAVSTKTKAARAKRESDLNKYATRKKAEVALTEESIWDSITEDFGEAPQVSLPGEGSSDNGNTDSLPEAMTSDKPEEAKAVSDSEVDNAEPKSERPKSKMFGKGEGEKEEPKEEEKKEESKEASSKTALLFMNEYDIDQANHILGSDPVLGPAAKFLAAFRDEVNSHSDGWPYWKAPVQAAAGLMTLLQNGMNARREGKAHTATVEDLKKAMSPIKAFMTRRGIAAGMTMPQLVIRKGAAKKEPKCWMCNGDGVLMASTGDPKHPMKTRPCPTCNGKKTAPPYGSTKKADSAIPDITEAKSETVSPDTVDADIKQETKSVEEAAKVAVVGAKPVKVVGCEEIDAMCGEKSAADVSGDISEAKAEVVNPDTIDADIHQPTESVEEAAKVGAAGDDHDEEVEMELGAGDLADLAANLPAEFTVVNE